MIEPETDSEPALPPQLVIDEDDIDMDMEIELYDPLEGISKMDQAYLKRNYRDPVTTETSPETE